MMLAPIHSLTFTMLVALFFALNVESYLVPRRGGSRSLAAAADGTRQLTNGERFARGLPPNKPIRRRAHPCPITGVMEVKLANGQSGYWDAATSTEGASTGNIGLTTNPDRLAGVYQFDPCGSNPGNVKCLNCNTHQDFSLAGITLTSRDNAEITSGSGSGYIQLTSSTVPGSTPQFVPSAQSSSGEYPTESTVWFYDGATSILTPQWVNPSGSNTGIITAAVNVSISLAIEPENNINHFVVQYPVDSAKSGVSGEDSGNGVHSAVVTLKIVPQQH
ncbi:hypothetical protein BDY19DRAFT_906708 [Irpex rosettiformis]|uniref:Uncharacterized protein n=1 Tax=Irpex rosettiformis TaxID=378272 RepID=A0ACB8U1R4_9APHY|nr:hypothetical protein BDY19DRAFT_906708 [Irpex rosettiformis]